MTRAVAAVGLWTSIGISLALAQPATRPAAAPATAPSTQPATQPASSPEVEALIIQLSDKQWKLRQQAQDRLVEMGAAAVDRLKQVARQTTDEEVRTRAEAALAQIESNDRSGPTLLTLNLEQAPVGIAVAEIAKQSKAEVAIWPPVEQQPNPAKVTIHVDRQPFWAVLREISKQTGLSPERMGNGGRITLMNNSGRWAQKPFSMQGPFLVVAESANLSHHVDFALPQNVQSSFSVQFRVYVDPKMRILRGTPQLRVEEAQDEKGNNLAMPENFFGGFTPNWGSRWIWDLSTSLKFQPGLGKRIARFRAATRFIVQSKADRWEINDVLSARNVEHPMPSGKYIFKGLSRGQGNQYTAQVGLEFRPGPRGGGFDPLLDQSMIQQAIRLIDAQGRSFMTSGGSGTSSSNGRAEYSFNFYPNSEDGRPLGAPARMVWDIPLETQEVSVPFRFDDLPIP